MGYMRDRSDGPLMEPFFFSFLPCRSRPIPSVFGCFILYIIPEYRSSLIAEMADAAKSRKLSAMNVFFFSSV